MSPEKLLPARLLKKSSLIGNEYTWKIEDIPELVDVAKSLGLLNIGGQLQFRFPQATCECYWIEVDVLKDESMIDLSWAEKVSKASVRAKDSFKKLQTEYDFLSEGRNGFAQVFEDYELRGNDPRDAMCFVWYLETETQAK